MAAQPFEVFKGNWDTCKSHINNVINGHARDCAMLFLFEAGKVLSQHRFRPGRVYIQEGTAVTLISEEVYNDQQQRYSQGVGRGL